MQIAKAVNKGPVRKIPIPANAAGNRRWGRVRPERGHGIQNDDINGTSPDEGADYAKRMMHAIRLGVDEAGGIDADAGSILWIEGVFGIEKRPDAPGALGGGDGLKAESCFPGIRRTEDLKEVASRKSAAAKSPIKGETSGRQNIRFHPRVEKDLQCRAIHDEMHPGNKRTAKGRLDPLRPLWNQ